MRGKRFPRGGRDPDLSPVSAYRRDVGQAYVGACAVSRLGSAKVTAVWSRSGGAPWPPGAGGSPVNQDTFTKYSRADDLPRYRWRNKREMPPKPAHGKHKSLRRSTRSGRGGASKLGG